MGFPGGWRRKRPLALLHLLSELVVRGDQTLGLRLPLVSSLEAVLDDARSPELRTYLSAIERDQGAMIQLTPEGMDLVLAGFLDRPGVRYQSTASMAPTPGVRSWLSTALHPWRAGSQARPGTGR